MINKILHILFILAGFIVLTSKSCEPEVDKTHDAGLGAKQDTTLTKIRSEFVSEYLLEDELMAYGEKAKQKLFDFSEYLSLYAEKNMDTLFKLQVREMLYRLFYSKDASIVLSAFPTDLAAEEKHHLTGLLNGIDASKYESIEFTPSDLTTIEPLHMESIERYTGKLGCNFRITGITGHDTTMLQESSCQVKIAVIRTNKQFGAETVLQVWQVFLVGIDTTCQ